MTAYNSVRMRVKAGHEEEFLKMNRKMDPELVARMKANGLRKATVIKTGERTYCFIGEWDSMDSIVKSRPDMIKDLDTMRHLLEDLGGGLGVTDPVSGAAVIEI
jgi:L-rhamnose mutarotase